MYVCRYLNSTEVLSSVIMGSTRAHIRVRIRVHSTPTPEPVHSTPTPEPKVASRSKRIFDMTGPCFRWQTVHTGTPGLEQ